MNRLGSTYWFLPSMLTLASVLLGVGLVHVDRANPDVTGWMGWAYGGGADGARALLSAVAGSTITVVSVTFSVLVVALTVSAQHFGPRLLNSFMRDNAAQLVLGTFTGTFAYCLVVLRTVQGDGGDRYSAFVPHLSVSGGVLLALLSIAILIYYVHHVSTSMHVSSITAAVVRDMENTIERLYPERIGESGEPHVTDPPPVPADAMAVKALRSGYVYEIDSGAVLDLARRHETTIWLIARPGDFVVAGSAVAAAHPRPAADADSLERELAGSYGIGNDRTPFQDAAFSVQQLVEVALHALSPSLNEPFTAVTCIDRLGQGLSKLAVRKIPSAVRTDDAGRVRVITKVVTFEELLHDAFDPIVRHGSGDPMIVGRLLDTLAHLERVAERPGDRAAIDAMRRRVLKEEALADRARSA